MKKLTDSYKFAIDQYHTWSSVFYNIDKNDHDPEYIKDAESIELQYRTWKKISEDLLTKIIEEMRKLTDK